MHICWVLYILMNILFKPIWGSGSWHSGSEHRARRDSDRLHAVVMVQGSMVLDDFQTRKWNKLGIYMYFFFR